MRMQRIGLSVGLVLTMLAGTAFGRQDLVKDPDGKTIAVVLDCSSCRGEKGSVCESGVEDGYDKAARCGQCLIRANYGHGIAIPYDIRMFGRLKDEDGKPLVGKYVRLLIPNPWSVRTRTLKDGVFVLRLGATVKRKSAKPLILDLGERRMKRDSKLASYSLFLLPKGHKPCESGKGAESQKAQ